MSTRYPWSEGSVALVGSASSLLDSSFGADIDSHDWVVRINQGAFAALSPVSTGMRTDFLFLTLTGGTVTAKLTFLVKGMRAAAQTVVIMSPKQRTVLGIDVSRFFPSYPPAWHRELHEKLGARPSTGAMAVDLLLRTMSDSSRLNLYGFDFFATPDIAHGRNRVVAHEPGVEEAYIRGVIDPTRFHESPHRGQEATP
jgi:hypothetical protein